MIVNTYLFIVVLFASFLTTNVFAERRISRFKQLKLGLLDQKTNLVWIGASSKLSTLKAAGHICEKLNKKEYAGIANWRLPKADELAGLAKVKLLDGKRLRLIKKTGLYWVGDKHRSLDGVKGTYYLPASDELFTDKGQASAHPICVRNVLLSERSLGNNAPRFILSSFDWKEFNLFAKSQWDRKAVFQVCVDNVKGEMPDYAAFVKARIYAGARGARGRYEKRIVPVTIVILKNKKLYGIHFRKKVDPRASYSLGSVKPDLFVAVEKTKNPCQFTVVPGSVN